MPTTKTAEKELRAAERKRERNKPALSLCKTSIDKAERLISSGQVDAAQKAVVEAVSTLDKAAEKGIIHANNAARRKSRLIQKLNKAQAPQAKATTPAG
ncbi:MAG: 30S ribosomal protein S20 [Chloroflexi bacterium]|nr:30S ribosomal protein S20 [Chloroflexota bacterium]